VCWPAPGTTWVETFQVYSQPLALLVPESSRFITWLTLVLGGQRWLAGNSWRLSAEHWLTSTPPRSRSTLMTPLENKSHVTAFFVLIKHSLTIVLYTMALISTALLTCLLTRQNGFQRHNSAMSLLWLWKKDKRNGKKGTKSVIEHHVNKYKAYSLDFCTILAYEQMVKYGFHRYI
jgi:hypothetical protein